jgi:hypothetical protein
MGRVIGTWCFAEWKEKPFTLLWRGSRDGFRAADFHSRCDDHTNTLTLVQDTKWNIFGGFTPLAWESYTRKKPNASKFKADLSRRSFLFTLKNPHALAQDQGDRLSRARRGLNSLDS